jgi:hypothetical protein
MSAEIDGVDNRLTQDGVTDAIAPTAMLAVTAAGIPGVIPLPALIAALALTDMSMFPKEILSDAFANTPPAAKWHSKPISAPWLTASPVERVSIDD